MVSRYDDQCGSRRLSDRVEQWAEGIVHIGDFAGVGVLPISSVEWRRRRVARMRIEHMHPGEPLARSGVDPRARVAHDFFSAPFGEREITFSHHATADVVVDVETLAKPELAIERE